MNLLFYTEKKTHTHLHTQRMYSAFRHIQNEFSRENAHFNDIAFVDFSFFYLCIFLKWKAQFSSNINLLSVFFIDGCLFVVVYMGSNLFRFEDNENYKSI